MGRGDHRSKRGKIWRGTFGKTRLKRKKNKKTGSSIASKNIKQNDAQQKKVQPKK